MTDNEMLQAMSDMLKPILSEMKDMKKDIAGLKSDVSDLKSDVSDIKLKVSSIDAKVDRNYDKTVEFYASQQEHNTEISDTLELVSGKLEIYADQTARNTLALKRYK